MLPTFFWQNYSNNKAFITAQALLESTRRGVWELIRQFRATVSMYTIVLVLLCEMQEPYNIMNYESRCTL